MHPKRSLKKRIIFALLGIVLAYAFIEFSTAVFVTLNYGSLPSIWHQRDRFVGLEADNAGEQRDPDAVVTILGEKIRPEILHPYTGYVRQPPPPDSRVQIEHEANAYGFSDTEPPIHHRAAGKVIVGIVGGSVAEQFATNALSALAAELSQSPHFAGRKFEFVNLALRGFKQPQQLMVINYLLTLGAEFDILVNLDGFNEVTLPNAENIPNGVSPIFPRQWHARIANMANPNVSKLLGYAAYLKVQRQESARTFAQRPLCYSPAATLVWWHVNKRQSAEIFRVQTQLDVLTHNQSAYGANGPKPEFSSAAEADRHLVELWSRASQLLNQLCAANGIAYYHFLQPNQYAEGTKPIEAPEKAVAINKDSPYCGPATRCYPLLIQEGQKLREKGVRYHDLTRVFADHPEPLYVDDCCHFNPQGDEILARAIAAAIVDDDAKTPAPPKK